MLLKSARETYARYLADPASDPVLRRLPAREQDERYRRNQMIYNMIQQASPFVVEEAALDLVATIRGGVTMVADIGPVLIDAPLPFDTTWMEFREEFEDGTHQEFGALIRKVGKAVLASSIHRTSDRQFVEPLIFLSIDDAGKADMVLDPYRAPELLRNYAGSQEERIGRLFEDAFPQTGWALLTAVSALQLIAAKDGPLDAEEEPLFSRPERRRLEREGMLPKGVATTVTRIKINEQGRLHLHAIDEEEGGPGGAKRRAHRVRGHFMRTVKGSSWRKAHVRGLGPVNETVRVISAGGIAGSGDPS